MIRCNLKAVLAKNRVTGKKLSEDTGITRTQIQKLNTSRVEMLNLKVLSILCTYLDCQPGDLLEEVDGNAVTPKRTNKISEAVRDQRRERMGRIAKARIRRVAPLVNVAEPTVLNLGV